MADVQGVERFCNHFAGALLVPKDSLQKDELARSIARSDIVSDRDLDQLAARFTVSKQVIWRRMQLTDLITLSKYQARLKAWEEEAVRKQRRSSYGVPPAKRCIQEKGHWFTTLVLEARDRDLITYRDVADYLSIRMKHLDKVQALLRERMANA